MMRLLKLGQRQLLVSKKHDVVLSRNDFEKVYELLDESPLEENCGLLCGRACCTDDTGETGIYLLPGEETMFERSESWLKWEVVHVEEYDFPPSWKDIVYFVRCTEPCPRWQRPIQCRTFPLAPFLKTDGTLCMVPETIPLPYHCFLQQTPSLLRTVFIEKAGAAWEILLKNRMIWDLVLYDSRRRNSPRPLWQKRLSPPS